MLLDSNIIGNTSEYFEKIGISEEEIDWNETDDPKYLVSIKEVDAIGEIIAFQVSFWCLRRLGNCCQSNGDTIRRMLREKIKFYEETFGKEYQDFNEDLIW
jgi:hypothetical protein